IGMTRSPPRPFSFDINGLTLEEVYRELDSEISQLQDRLCSLRTFRNSLPPISKIPMELLSKIFHHSQEDDSSPFSDDVDIRTRFFISWVCRHWRETALITPSLW
ncbi:hypothetical protein BDN72DRAFT_748754, partial [Pluteus cervinus]